MTQMGDLRLRNSCSSPVAGATYVVLEAISALIPHLTKADVVQWYSADLDYGRTTVYLFCAGIIVWGLANLIFKLRQSSR